MHIGSTVRGENCEDKDALDAIEAVLPAGTLSGAPKIRACQLIGELENNKRGIYGGAIEYIDFTGNMDTCIINSYFFYIFTHSLRGRREYKIKKRTQ